MAAPQSHLIQPSQHRSASSGVDCQPVFICGASRSGTTVVQYALEQLTGAYITPETHYFDDLRVELRHTLGRPLEIAELKLVEARFRALSDRPYGHGGQPENGWLNEGDLEREVGDRGLHLDELFEAYNRLGARRKGLPWGGEKTPRHVYRIDDILERFPDAKILVMVRDPRAVVASYRHWSGSTMRETVDEGDPQAQLERQRVSGSYHPVTVSLLWRAAWRAATAARRKWGDECVRVQSYEDLVTSPETVMDEVAQWLGLARSQGGLEIPLVNSSFEADKRGLGGRSVAIDRWRTLLTPAEVRVVEQAAGAALEAAGYERQASGGHFGAALSWLSFLPAAGRAVRRNAGRSGSLPGYVWRRARLAMGRP